MATHKPDWHVDHTLLDVMVTDRKMGKPLGRPKMRVEIDRRTRKIKRIRLEGPDDTENGSEESSDQ